MSNKKEDKNYWEIIKSYFNMFNYLDYIIKHKEKLIIYITIFGFLLQIIIIFFLFGIEGLQFMSLKFSLVLSSIVLFGIFFGGIVALIVIPILIWNFGVLSVNNLYFWIILIISIFIVFLMFKKGLDDKLDAFEEKYNSFIKLNIKMLFIIIIMLNIKIILLEKPVRIFMGNSIITGDLVLYNQDNYFLKSGNKKIIIPYKNVDKVEFIITGNKNTIKGK